METERKGGMGFLQNLFGGGISGLSREAKQEAERLIAELIQIGKQDDYLSERPGMPFNMQCRHVRARQIGTRLNELGGMALMEYAHDQVLRKLKAQLASHLEYAWTDIGEWKA
jgi:hypothetical protein